MARSGPFLLTSGLLVGAAAALLAALPACRGGAPGDLPAASLPASDEEPPPSDLAAAPPPSHVSPDGPRLYARALETRVLERPDPRARVLGYVRIGQSVPRSTSPVPGVSCDAGWYEVLPHGYVCLDAGATLDPKDSVLRALGGTRPDLSKPMPYLYAFARRDATLWHMVPDHKLMDKWEYAFQGHLKDYKKHHAEWNRIKAAGANEVPLDADGNAKMLPRDVPPVPAALDEEHLFPDIGDGSVPWWLDGSRKIPNVSPYVAPEGSVVRGKVARHAGLAVLGSFRTGKESDHRKFTVLLDGRLIGEDKIKPHFASPFHGIALDGSAPATPTFPFAMVRRRDAEYFDRAGDTVGHPAYGDVIPLNGKILPKDQRFFFETQDRRWRTRGPGGGLRHAAATDELRLEAHEVDRRVDHVPVAGPLRWRSAGLRHPRLDRRRRRGRPEDHALDGAGRVPHRLQARDDARWTPTMQTRPAATSSSATSPGCSTSRPATRSTPPTGTTTSGARAATAASTCPRSTPAASSCGPTLRSPTAGTR